MKKQLLIVAGLLLGTMFTANAQEAMEANPTTPTMEGFDTLNTKIDMVKEGLDKLNKLKISGYIQAQYQMADSNGQKGFAGGDFNEGVDKRFSVRRGRVKFTYDGNMTQYVLQFDVTEKGLAIKDAYAKFTEPFLKTFSLTAGVMNRPFGYEIGYSSSMRESPERGRMSQIIFKDERDLGAMITIETPKTSPLNFVKIEAGLYNGSGPGAADYDKFKDFIGHIVLKKSMLGERLKVTGGVSYYNGTVTQGFDGNFTKYLYTMNNNAFTVDSSRKAYQANKRQYYGADAQVSFDWFGGLTTVRGEYITGEQPTYNTGTSNSQTALTSPSSYPAPVAPVTKYVFQTTSKTEGVYIRKFNGAYFYFLQNIGQSKHQIVVKYDWFDPNTEVSGADIKKTSKLGLADAKFTTLGLGWVYRMDNNVKLTAYYDMVKNESTGIANYGSDIKDNIFTLRLQYKF